MKKPLFVLCLLAAALLASDAEVDALLGGFETPADTGVDAMLEGFGSDTGVEIKRAASDEERPYEINGEVTLQGAYNYRHSAGEKDHFGLSQLQAALFLEGRYKTSWAQAVVSARGFYDGIYSLEGRSGYPDAMLREYEHELELFEAYADFKPKSSFDLRLGRQIVVWGKSDNLRVTDRLNPMDLRRPGMTDIKELRLPVWMSRMDYYAGSWRLSALAIHEPRFSKWTHSGSAFHPEGAPDAAETTPSIALEKTQGALAAEGTFSGWDLAFYLSRQLDDRGHIVLSDGLRREHPWVTFAGTAFNAVAGSWLYKMEAGYTSGLRADLRSESLARADLLGGVEYQGISKTVFSLELLYKRYLENLGSGFEQTESQAALRLNRQLWHDTLDITALVILGEQGSASGGFARLWGEYDMGRGRNFTLGIAHYIQGDYMPFGRMGDASQLFMKYSAAF